MHWQTIFEGSNRCYLHPAGRVVVKHRGMKIGNRWCSFIFGKSADFEHVLQELKRSQFMPITFMLKQNVDEALGAASSACKADRYKIPLDPSQQRYPCILKANPNL